VLAARPYRSRLDFDLGPWVRADDPNIASSIDRERIAFVTPRAVQTMETEAVAQLIRNGLPGAEVEVTGDGSHFEAIVVSDAFSGLTPIKKQRLVMDTVKAEIASGELHALSIKTLTPDQKPA
jgi:acid stress-induced BolA-like protein IbaG/YrbA